MRTDDLAYVQSRTRQYQTAGFGDVVGILLGAAGPVLNLVTGAVNKATTPPLVDYEEPPRLQNPDQISNVSWLVFGTSAILLAAGISTFIYSRR